MARQTMKTCVLDGATLADAAAVYRKLGEAFAAPAYFGHNPDALWDAMTEYHGEPVEIVWRDAAQSVARLGRQFDDIVAVLKRAEKEGRLKLSIE
jgi:RNAse (barnase) inhibitor barstar